MLKKISGFTITEVLIATALLSILATVLTSGLLSIDKDMSQVERVTTLNVLRMSILSQLQNDGAWKATVNDSNNTNLLCIKNQSPCAVQGLQPFRLNDAAGNLVYDSTASKSGFSTDGSQCSTYNDSTGSDECPFRAELNWQPDCVSPCTPSGLVKISATLKFNPQSVNLKKFLASQNYNIEVIRKAVVP